MANSCFLFLGIKKNIFNPVLAESNKKDINGYIPLFSVVSIPRAHIKMHIGRKFPSRAEQANLGNQNSSHLSLILSPLKVSLTFKWIFKNPFLWFHIHSNLQWDSVSLISKVNIIVLELCKTRGKPGKRRNRALCYSSKLHMNVQLSQNNSEILII